MARSRRVLTNAHRRGVAYYDVSYQPVTRGIREDMTTKEDLDAQISAAETKLKATTPGTWENREAVRDLRHLKSRKVIDAMTGPRDANGPTAFNPTGRPLR